MHKKSISWAWIIFWIIFAWPIGLFLIIKKIADEKSALMNARTGPITVIAWIFIILGVFALIGYSNDQVTDRTAFILIILFLIGGILLLRKSKQINKIARKYKRYIDLVINRDYRSLDAIAFEMGLPCEAVVKDLQKMIDIGYLKGAYINMDARTIEFRPYSQSPQPAPSQNPYQQPAPSSFLQSRPAAPAISQNQALAQKVPVRCPSCGAKNVVTAGQITECEYCGSPIKA